MASSSNNFPQLKSENFNNWIFRVECILEEKGLLKIIKDDNERSKETFTKDNAKAKNIIVQCLPDKYLNTVKTCELAKEMIKVLKELFQRKSIISIIQLRRKLINLKQSPDEKLEDYFEKFDSIVRELDCSEDKLTDRDKIAYLLTGLQSKYDTVITAIECNTDLMSSTIKLDFVRARLLDEELKITDKHRSVDETRETAFITCFKCNKPGHLSKNCRTYLWRGRGRSRGTTGHRTPRQQHSGHYGHIAINSNEREIDFGCITTDNLQDISNNSSSEYNIRWVIDSGCTEHLINEKYEKYMTKIVRFENPIKIYIANGDFITTEKKGYIVMTCGKIKINLEALIIKNLSFNLMSVKKMVQNNYNVIFSKDYVKICKQNSYDNVYGSCVGKLFILNAEICFNVSYSANSSSNSEDMWHKRLGHLNRRSLRYMHLPVSKKTCSSCMMGKSTRLPFLPVQRPRSRYIGELIHSDIAGPVRTPGINGELYYQVVIDDYSHFCHTYLLRHKSDATANLINYIRRFEIEYAIKINRVRCDNGGELKNQIFESFCRERGISIEYTQPYSPQQNGVSERMNRTLYDRVRTLLLDTNLPKYLWGEAIACATYQLNRCPSAAIHFKTPESIMRGRNDISRLRVFGSKAWVVTMPRGDKLAPRSKEMRMVGYSSNGYRLWDPKINKIVISRDVRFDESDIIYKENTREMREVEQTNSYKYEEEEESTDEKQGENQKQLQRDNNINEQGENSHTIDAQVQEREEEEVVEQRVTGEERQKRTIKMPERYTDYIMDEDFHDANVAYCLLSDSDPKTYKEAISQGPDWKKAINDEIESLEELNTWKEAELPPKQKAIDTKWMFKTKQDGRKKARLVAKGFQTNNEYNVYSPVARISTIRMMFSQAVQENYHIKQLDVQTAFLNGYLNTEVYIKPPEGVKVTQGKVLKLQRSLYGLREAPKCWNERFHNYIMTQGFEQSKHDFCLYSKANVWLLIWVDDILVTGKQSEISKTTSKLNDEFKIRDLGDIKEYLGMEIRREDGTLKISQTKMIQKILEKFGMDDCKGAQTPMEQGTSMTEEETIEDVPYRELIGCLIYIATISRPDITFTVSYLSRYLDKPTKATWTSAKRVLRYLKITSNKCLTYTKSMNKQLQCYTDADWASDKEDRKSVSGCCIFHNGNLVSWFTKKQQTVALSSAEAEYVAAAMATSELVYLKGILCNFGCSDIKTHLLVDNQSTIKMIECNENSKRTKHIDIKYHFIKDNFTKNVFSISYVSTNENIADIFTKSLGVIKHNFFLNKLKILQ